MGRTRAILIWAALALAVLVPLAFAASSPLLQWRGPAYIAAGFAGVIALALLLVQPLLVGGHLPGLAGLSGRRVHRWVGGTLVAAVIVHVAGLWISSPPDVIDALTFSSPTPFSNWGVVAMWAVFAAALLAALRQRLKLRPRTWRMAHTGLVVVVVISTAVHAWLIEGTMEVWSKAALSALSILATAIVVGKLKAWSSPSRSRS